MLPIEKLVEFASIIVTYVYPGVLYDGGFTLVILTTPPTAKSLSTVNTATLSVTGAEYVDTVTANTTISTPKVSVTTLVDANGASAYFNTIQTQGQLSVGGNFVINGSTVYNSNTFTLSAASNNQISYVNVYRSPGANASIRWNEIGKYWDVLDVNDTTYYRILHNGYLNNSLKELFEVTGKNNFEFTLINNVSNRNSEHGD